MLKQKVIKTLKKYNLSHVGSCLSCVDIVEQIFKHKKEDDLFILSKGHAAVTLYCQIMDDPDMTKLSEHPDRNVKLGIPHTTGSLGHGLPLSVGHAWVGTRTHVLVSDGELDEGSNWEAIRFVGEKGLGKVRLYVDLNGFQAYKATNTNSVIADKFRSFGWACMMLNGHNKDPLERAVKMDTEKTPLAVICRTTKHMNDNKPSFESHYKKL